VGAAQSLSQAIHNRLNALGIEGYTMHGLRKNAGMELAEAGATVEEIMVVLAQDPEDGDVLLRAGAPEGYERERGDEVGCFDRKDRCEEARQERATIRVV
jgi:hypothetical protein